jgi:hypothetical protein
MGRASLVRFAACVAGVVSALALVGCTQIFILMPNGQSVAAILDIDPYQKRYVYYYDDPRTGQRKRVPSEWLNKQDEYRQAARSGSDLFSAVAQGQVVFDTTESRDQSQRRAYQSALPGGHCPGEVPGQNVAERGPDLNTLLAKIRECLGGNGSGARF